MNQWAKQKQTGFTIVELLIVVVVIAILAAITIVAYNGINDRAKESSAKAAADQALKKVEAQYVQTNAYPATLADVGITDGATTFGYTAGTQYRGACVWAQTGNKQFSKQAGMVLEGDCGQVVATYYGNHSFSSAVFSRAEASIANVWGGGSPDARIPADTFLARYTTRIIPPVTGDYIFYTTTDDNAELLVDGQTVIPWTASGVREASTAPIALTAGVPVSIQYSMREYGGNAYATLGWSYPGQARVTVPASAYVRQ